MADWSTACPDWERRLFARESLVPDLPLFREEADRALRVFKRLRIPDMIGMPSMGDVAGPWLFPIVEAIFGSYDPETNCRMVQEFFWLIPKKNTKTSSAAAIMVEALILNRRPEGEFVLVAPTKEIAGTSFRQAAGTIRADPELAKLFQIQTHLKTITHRKMGSSLMVKAADTDVITGGKQVGTLIDELHVLAAKSNAADIMVELRGALTARADGFLITITTQSKAPPEGVFKAELAKARAVRDGRLSLPLLPILYELPVRMQKDGESWKNRAYWPAVNPNLSRSVREEFLEGQLITAEIEGKEALALLASQHFNVEIGIKLRADRWAGADFWENAVESAVTLERMLRCCDAICVGVDGGGSDDLASLYVLGRENVPDKDVRFRRWFGWGHSWAFDDPEKGCGVLQRRQEIAAKLRDFEKDHDLTIFQRPSDDVAGMLKIIKMIYDAGLLCYVACDPAGKMVSELIDALADAKIDDGNEADPIVISVSQGWKLQEQAGTIERRLMNGLFVPADQAIMKWAVGNAKTEPHGNAEVITKAASGKAKIDPLIAALTAVKPMSHHPQARGSVYSADRGLVVFG